MRTPVLIMTVGLPASGKSTWTEKQVRQAPPGSVIRVNNDDLGATLHAGRRGGEQTRKHLEAVRDMLIEHGLRTGLTVIVDNTNIHPRHETRLRELAAMYGAVFRIQDFTKVPVETCIERDAARPAAKRVGKDVITRMSRDLARRKPAVEPLYPQPYIAPAGAPTCYIADVDGTVALMGNRRDGARGPYDWHRVGEDMPNEPVVELVQTLLLAGETVVFMSGRDGICRPATQDWLDKYVAPGLELHMRAPGDDRPDYLVKFELFQAHIAGRRVKGWLDDRNQVISMGRRILGLPVWQVAEGFF